MKKKVVKYTPNRIAEIRGEKGLSVEQVALLLEVKPLLVLAWEEGSAVPDTFHLLKLSALLNSSPELLYPELYKKLLNDFGE